MCGRGTYESPDGSTYTGDWESSLPHGFGVMIYSNGDCYEGNWKAGERQGSGSMQYSDGQKYSGPWNKDERVYPTLGGGLGRRASSKLNIETVPRFGYSFLQKPPSTNQ